MKNIVVTIMILIVALPMASFAQSTNYGDPNATANTNAMETTSDSIARHSAENYEYQQQHGMPLGGYPEKMGDPASVDTINPGYNSNAGGGYGSSQ